MNQYTVVELPSDLAAAIERSIAGMRAAASESPVDLSATPGGRSIAQAMTRVGPELAAQWSLFDKKLGGRSFIPRMYLFGKVGKGDKTRWPLKKLTMASHYFLTGSAAKLRDMSEKLGANETTEHFTLWVWPAPHIGPGKFFALARHQDGTEAAFEATNENWKQLPAGPLAITSIVEGLISPDRKQRSQWVGIMSDCAVRANQGMREALTPLLREWGAPEPSEESWRTLLESVFLRETFLDSILEAGRYLAEPVIYEAHNLLGTLQSNATEAQERHANQVSRLEREHAREMKRLRSEMNRTEVSLDGAHTRNRQLAKEIAAMKDAMKAAPAIPAGTPQAPEASSLGAALDKFFV